MSISAVKRGESDYVPWPALSAWCIVDIGFSFTLYQDLFFRKE